MVPSNVNDAQLAFVSFILFFLLGTLYKKYPKIPVTAIIPVRIKVSIDRIAIPPKF